MKLKFYLAVLILVIAALACSVGGGAEPGVLFQDDFSINDSGWDVSADEIATVNYHNGEYRIWVNEVQYDVWGYAGKSYDNVDITVEARKQAGPDDNNFGIICRAVSDNDFYMGLIASDGFYAILKMDNGEYQPLSDEYFEYSDAIKQGASTNTIRLTCIDDTLTLYVNDVELATAQDSQFSTGDVGLLAGSFDTAGVDIRFDNFVVREP